jgi:phasin family protein
MQGTVNQFAALNKTALDATLDAWLMLAEGATNLGKLQVEAAKVLFQESAEAGRSLAAAKSLEDLTPKAKAVAVTGAEKALGYSRNVYEISTGTGVQLFELLNAASAEFRKGWGSALEGLANSTAIGKSDATGSAFKSMLSTSEAVIEGLTKTAKQSMQLADTAIKNAATAAASATKAIA